MVSTYSNSKRGSPFGLIIFAIILAAIIMFMVTNYSNHAFDHGDDSFQCNNGNFFDQKMNPNTGRIAKICLTELGKFGIQIVENDGETIITQYVKNKMKTIDQVLRYLKNTGYTE